MGAIYVELAAVGAAIDCGSAVATALNDTMVLDAPDGGDVKTFAACKAEGGSLTYSWNVQDDQSGLISVLSASGYSILGSSV